MFLLCFLYQCKTFVVSTNRNLIVGYPKNLLDGNIVDLIATTDSLFNTFKDLIVLVSLDLNLFPKLKLLS